jgi:hypothetical protein
MSAFQFRLGNCLIAAKPTLTIGSAQRLLSEANDHILKPATDFHMTIRSGMGKDFKLKRISIDTLQTGNFKFTFTLPTNFIVRQNIQV